MNSDKTPRRPRLVHSADGLTYIWRRSPYLALWWAASFSGFGKVLQGQYARGILLTLAEVIINLLSRFNEAMVYSFCGRFELAKATLQPRWMYGYLVVYIFTMWNAYRSTLTYNRVSHLAELENARIKPMVIHPVEIQFLERKNPIMGAFWSFAFPGLGLLYNQKVALGIYNLLWWWIFASMSNFYDSIFLLFYGRFEESIAVLDPQWLLYMPSVLGGSVYYGYILAVDQNHLFMVEQKQYFEERYKGESIRIFPSVGGEYATSQHI